DHVPARQRNAEERPLDLVATHRLLVLQELHELLRGFRAAAAAGAGGRPLEPVLLDADMIGREPGASYKHKNEQPDPRARACPIPESGRRRPVARAKPAMTIAP